MPNTVPSQSIAFMTVSLAVAVALPVGLCIYFRKVKKADILPFFIGCAVMAVFAFILEALVHQLILPTKAGEAIQGNVWTYALYGGLMAGLFEETGRFLAFKTVLRRYREKDANALMYGAGHGGIEAFAILGIASVNNIVYSLLINSGNMSLLTGQLPENVLEQVEGAVRALVTTPSWQFLMGGAERIFAVVLHLALSVFVWFAAKKKNRILLYPAAVLIHLIVDAATVVLSRNGASLFVTEGAVAAASVIAALLALLVWKRNAAPAPAVEGSAQEPEI